MKSNELSPAELQAERNELSIKLHRLEAFLDSVVGHEVTKELADQLELLVQQRLVMMEYISILDNRIALLQGT
ncbi:hypothetical protein VspSw1_19 [Vibrio phage VspSw_1]|uniref:Uncharacterized protein n=1 Tax=Vibrio phage VspSw_1 TaxID=2484249 RepID=A0A411BKF9_9CAUD|nr:hypothetical protein HOV08_gp019 [Vibrio phage VspSw_1]QAY02093.1 hypothetical protein VspSw1_19 [Vibrio phage VspSw_1]